MNDFERTADGIANGATRNEKLESISNIGSTNSTKSENSFLPNKQQSGYENPEEFSNNNTVTICQEAREEHIVYQKGYSIKSLDDRDESKTLVLSIPLSLGDNSEEEEAEKREDNFSEFSNFQPTDQFQLYATEHELSELEQKIKDIQLELSRHVPEVHYLQSIIRTDRIWNLLECFEKMPALKYQWSNSYSRKKYLKALCVDEIISVSSIKLMQSPSDLFSSSSTSESNKHHDIKSSANAILEIISSYKLSWLKDRLLDDDVMEAIISLMNKNDSHKVKFKTKDIMISLPKLHFVKYTEIKLA